MGVGRSTLEDLGLDLIMNIASKLKERAAVGRL